MKHRCSLSQITERPGLQRPVVLIQFQPRAVCRVANQQTQVFLLEGLGFLFCSMLFFLKHG